MTVRRMTVVRCPGTMDRPMIKIANSTLETMGFTMGASIEITYQEGLLIVKKIDKTYDANKSLQEPRCPVPNTVQATVSPDREDSRSESSARNVKEIVCDTIYPARFVLA